MWNLCIQNRLRSAKSAIFACVFDSHNVYYEKIAPPKANVAQGGWGEFLPLWGCRGQQRQTLIMHARRCKCKRARFCAVASRYNARPALSAAFFSCVSAQKSALQELLLICKAFFTEINLCAELENVYCVYVKLMHSKEVVLGKISNFCVCFWFA